MSVSVKNSPLAIDSPKVTSPYGPRDSGTHHGIDFGVPEGTPILSVDQGTVITSKFNSGGYGYYVVVEHSGYFTLYAHMRAMGVPVGTTVLPGDIIGYVGSTGRSTGNHLHFEIRVGANTENSAVNPASYLENVVTLSGNIITDSTRTPNTTSVHADSVPYTPLSIIGTRTSEFTDQPMHAYVNIYIGNKLLSTEPPKPNIFQSFEFDRLKDAGSTGRFVVFDDSWEEIEYYLSNNWNDVYIEYGYANTNLKVRYKVMVQSYSIEFNFTGVTLSVEVLSEGSYQNLTPVNISTGTYNPTEAIKSICKSVGWIVRDENFDATVDVKMDHPFDSAQEYPATYITSVILPLAQTDNGEILNFSLESTEEGTVAYLKKLTYGTTMTGIIRTYIYQKGYDSVVEDLSFDIQGVFGGTSRFYTVTGAKTSVFNTLDKSQSNYKEDTNSTTTETTGEFSHTRADQSVVLVDSAGNTPEQASNKLYYYIKNADSSHYQATMTIIGDPMISFFDTVRLINVTDNGYLHHTSGIYMIDKVSDTISNGTMSTSLHLIRNGTINQGVELLNFRDYIK